MERILISPPFGSYLSINGTTSVLGSYTLHDRPGRFKKTCQFLLDNWRYPVEGGYRNRIGLKNPGVASLKVLSEDKIYSFVGLEPYDWAAIWYVLMGRQYGFKQLIELNISCPNVHEYSIQRDILERYTKIFTVIVKLPPDLEKILPLVDMCGEAGVRYLHCSNTVPSQIGGLSGYPLKTVNLPIIERLAKEWTVIGGGGIYNWQDLLDYSNAGATYFSMSTAWIHPFKALKLVKQFYREGV